MNLRNLIWCLIFLIYPTYAYSSGIQFCDGSYQIEKSREQCTSGFNFGVRKPSCVCIKGIYRLYTDTCETADGFADNVCTKLYEPTSNATIVGLKLTKTPVDWTQTGVVCERVSRYGVDVWDLLTGKSNPATVRANHIYTLNGVAFWGTGSDGKPEICVKPATLDKNKKICKYLSAANQNVWGNQEVGVRVSNVCKGVLLKANECFGVLKTSDSECSLQCKASSKDLMKSALESKDLSKPVRVVKSSGFGENTVVVPEKGNLTNPADYRRHDSKYLNRQLILQNLFSQMDNSAMPAQFGSNVTKPPPYGEPKRIFEIFDIMKNLTMKFCPSQFVRSDWIDMVANLFYVLHNGNVYRYEETLTAEQYLWIKDILSKCDASMVQIELINKLDGSNGNTGAVSGDPLMSCGAEFGGRATGYCNGIDNTTQTCNYKPVTVSPDRANSSYHYVPEVAWDIVDLIHVACFDQFNASYRMFHVLEQAAERLFTLQIKNLWYYPGWSAKTKTKMLGAGADTQLYNFEACIESAYNKNGKIPRLVRPMAAKYIRRRRSVNNGTPSFAQNAQVYCRRGKTDFSYPDRCPRL